MTNKSKTITGGLGRGIRTAGSVSIAKGQTAAEILEESRWELRPWAMTWKNYIVSYDGRAYIMLDRSMKQATERAIKLFFIRKPSKKQLSGLKVEVIKRERKSQSKYPSVVVNFEEQS